MISALGKIGVLNFMVAKKFSQFNASKSLSILALSLLPCFSSAAEMYYYDGTIKRSLIVDNQQWANVKSGKSIELRSLSSNEKSAKSITGSPVFRNGESGAPMALPGGIIVQPKANDSSAEAKLKARGLEVERTIGQSGALLVKSPEGLSSLQLANQLHESGEFESASPNWWRERRKK
jgi:hypothetical protein